MLLGHVDDVDGHYVATKFVALLLPVSSMYVTETSFERTGGGTRMSWKGVELPLQWRSAALGLLRVWPWFLAIAWPFLTHWGENVSRVPSSTYWTSAGFVALALLALVPGRLPAREKARLRALGRESGLRIDPARLPRHLREMQRQELEEKVQQAGLPTGAQRAAELAPSLAAEVVPLVYVLAAYSCDDPAWAPVEAALRARLPSA